MKLKTLVLPLLLVIPIYGTTPVYAEENATPKNIILFIGDGMGISQITAGKITKDIFNLERFKVIGLLTTHSQNALITDSAAAGTALATGYKTYNGAISVSKQGNPIKTIIEYAEEKQKSTGLVVTSSITHATPAAFIAHVDDREKQEIIAEHITQSSIDVLLGGGWGYFIPKSEDGSKRNDDKNLIAKLEKRMKIVRSAEEFEKLRSIDSVAGFFADDHLPPAINRKPRLSDLTQKAIAILSKNKNGFFLMVEGSQIDWAGHDNNQEYLINEMVDFDNAVGVGLNFADKDSQTLVVVTSDHETGGFALHEGSIKDKKVTKSGFTTKEHTASMVPVFAYGSGSSVFAGIADNTMIGKVIIGYVQGKTIQQLDAPSSK